MGEEASRLPLAQPHPSLPPLQGHRLPSRPSKAPSSFRPPSLCQCWSLSLEGPSPKPPGLSFDASLSRHLPTLSKEAPLLSQLAFSLQCPSPVCNCTCVCSLSHGFSLLFSPVPFRTPWGEQPTKQDLAPSPVPNPDHRACA